MSRRHFEEWTAETAGTVLVEARSTLRSGSGTWTAFAFGTIGYGNTFFGFFNDLGLGCC